jgi:hypothetical protein
VWNVETAQGFGLDIWGRIVNIGRELTVPVVESYFGFSAGISDENNKTPFNGSPFFVRGNDATDTIILADDAYRRLILFKALANISATTAPSMNRLLQNLFEGRGRCYVNDMGNMLIRYTFEFLLTPSELSMVINGVLPRPAGVKAYMIMVDGPCFGFAPGATPFNEAPFISESATYAIS